MTRQENKKARNASREAKHTASKQQHDDLNAKYRAESGWTPETHLYVGLGKSIFNVGPTANVKQDKYGMLCAKLAVNALLTVPMNESMVIKFKNFRMSCWEGAKEVKKLKPQDFCAPKVKAAKWDFIIEYLQQSRGVTVKKLKDIVHGGLGKNCTITRLTSSDYHDVPLVAFTQIPKAPRVNEYHHVVAIKGGMVYDCDNDNVVPIADYPNLRYAKNVYVLSPTFPN
jgi:hypothetical protein